MFVSVSKMSGKLEGIEAINTSPLSNPFCASRDFGICKECYSKKAIGTYRANCHEPWHNNGILLSTQQIEILPQITAAFVRFHAHGELFNMTHYSNFVRICHAYPDTHFALWTKRPNLTVHIGKPKNLKLIHSVHSIDGKHDLPLGFDTSFRIVTGGATNCEGKCIKCLRCWKSSGETDCLLRRK